MEQETNFPLYIGRTYTHKNGGKYILNDTCLVQIDDVWHNGLIYQSCEEVKLETFVRTREDFASSFTMDPLPEGYHNTKSFTAEPQQLHSYDRIRVLQADTDKDDYQVLAAISEEHGELAGAMAIEDQLHGKAHKTVDEPSTHEAVDVVITALALFFQRGGTRELLDQVMESKLDKWERNINNN